MKMRKGFATAFVASCYITALGGVGLGLDHMARSERYNFSQREFFPTLFGDLFESRQKRDSIREKLDRPVVLADFVDYEGYKAQAHNLIEDLVESSARVERFERQLAVSNAIDSAYTEDFHGEGQTALFLAGFGCAMGALSGKLKRDYFAK